MKAAGLDFNLNILKQLIARIRAAIDFLDNHKVYFEWLIFRGQLSQDRLTLLHFLEQQELIWEDVFKEIFLRNVFSQFRSRLLPLDFLQAKLEEQLGESKKAFMNISLRNIDNGVVKLGLFDQAPGQYSNAYDYLFINAIPGLEKLKDIHFNAFGWTSEFDQQMVGIKKSDNDYEFKEDSALFLAAFR